MKGFGFFKKEINEIIKTHKVIVLPAVLLFFGFLSPIFAKFTPQLLAEVFKSQGMAPVKIPDPTFLDSYGQLFKNFTQLGIIVIILVFMSVVVEEKVKGSAVLVLTKTVTRAQFILSKCFASLTLYTVSFVLSVVACVYYTYLLFPAFYNDQLVLSLFMLWLYGVFMISITIFASTISKTHTIAAVLSITGFIISVGSSAIPYVSKISPGSLGAMGLSVLGGKAPVTDAVAPLIAGVVFSVMFIWGSVLVFRRQEL